MQAIRLSRFALTVLVLATIVATATHAGPVNPGPMQEETSVYILDGELCSDIATLYTQPVNMNLVIGWVGIESLAEIAADPVDIDIEVDTGTGAVLHPLVRLEDSVQTAGSFFATQRWSSEVLFASAVGNTVRAQACRNGSQGDHIVRITFTGRLRLD